MNARRTIGDFPAIDSLRVPVRQQTFETSWRCLTGPSSIYGIREHRSRSRRAARRMTEQEGRITRSDVTCAGRSEQLREDIACCGRIASSKTGSLLRPEEQIKSSRRRRPSLEHGADRAVML